MFVRILLVCGLGEDVSEYQIDYWVGGKLTKVNVGYSLRETLHKLFDRITYPHIFFFPFMINYFITPADRDVKANATLLRNLVS